MANCAYELHTLRAWSKNRQCHGGGGGPLVPPILVVVVVDDDDDDDVVVVVVVVVTYQLAGFNSGKP